MDWVMGATMAVVSLVVIGLAAFLILPSIRIIGPTQVGLRVKRFSLKKLHEDNPVAFNGEAGYQAELLMPGWRWAFWLLYRVENYPWVQVPAGEIGVVIAQIGQPTKIGAKSAEYKPEFGNFSDIHVFVNGGGQKGVQRPVLQPGTLAPIHPVAFLVITKNKVYGLPVSPELARARYREGGLTHRAFGLEEWQLELVRIAPRQLDERGVQDVVGVVTTLEGDPLPAGAIASRLGEFDDVEQMEAKSTTDAEMIEVILGSKNDTHNNYQDFQRFLDQGGKMGLQHDPLLYGAYALNPFLTRVELVPMLMVRQGEVAVIKAYVGLSTQDTSGEQFKFGSLVRPGHRGIWREPMRTGKYPINPRCYQAEIVPTAILTLNWAEGSSEAHNLDRQLSQITAKSNEGFVFKIDLQVQIHVADTNAPMVISMVGTMQNLVNEVLQASVGNHFRNKLQSMRAIQFIETRQQVQQDAEAQVRLNTELYKVETRGVYIQDVILPPELVTVLTQREIANQEIKTFEMQRSAQVVRIDMEQAKGRADMQADLAKSAVGVEIKKNNANARMAEADGESTYIRKTGEAQGAQVEAVGMARAKAYKAQVEALGQGPTAAVNVVTALAESKVRFVPEILVAGGSGSGSVDGLLAATLMGYLKGGTPASQSPNPSSGNSPTRTEPLAAGFPPTPPAAPRPTTQERPGPQPDRG